LTQAVWRGRCAYHTTLDEQRRHREAIINGDASEVVWALEHEPVITTGRREVLDLPEPSWLKARGVEVCATKRGGLATYHGPGQLVVYYLLDVRRRGGVRNLVCSIESGVLAWLQARGVDAYLSERGRGVWANDRKICAVGLHVRRGVTMHGMALNLHPDLTAYTWFSPCGFEQGSVTSLYEQQGESPPPSAVWEEVVGMTLKGAVDIQDPER
jgi:lipoyl(octanoyl) transferase